MPACKYHCAHKSYHLLLAFTLVLHCIGEYWAYAVMHYTVNTCTQVSPQGLLMASDLWLHCILGTPACLVHLCCAALLHTVLAWLKLHCQLQLFFICNQVSKSGQHHALWFLFGMRVAVFTIAFLAALGASQPDINMICLLHVLESQCSYVLAMQVCADTLIGDDQIRGVSGGQRKRVTTGGLTYQQHNVVSSCCITHVVDLFC